MVEYSDDFKYAYYDGYKFIRDNKTGYYLSSARTDLGRQERLHAYMWRKHNGKPPKGYHVHHEDGNKQNNELENLVLIEQGEHLKLHGASLSTQQREWRRDNLAITARPKASVWHRSEVGREWHRIQGKKVMAAREPRTFICEQCGGDFQSRQYSSRFCCNACKSQWRRDARVDNIVCECAICGTKFSTNKYSKSKTCSPACANKLRWANRKEKESCAICRDGIV